MLHDQFFFSWNVKTFFTAIYYQKFKLVSMTELQVKFSEIFCDYDVVLFFQ